MKNKGSALSIHRRKKLGYQKTIFVCIMLAPMILHLLIFWLGVQVQSLKLAFVDVDDNFTFDNFKSVFRQLAAGSSSNSVLPEALRNTFIFAAIGLLEIPVHIFVAYIIWRKMAGYKLARMLMYTPALFGSLVFAIMYQQMFVSDGIMLTFLNGKLGLDIPTPIIMNKPIPFIAIFDFWVGIGSNIIIWFGAMGRIPKDLIESGYLDGISAVREFVSIVFPLIFPTFSTMITLKLIGVLSASGSIMIFTEGNYGTFTLSYWLYHIVYKGISNTYGIAAAVGLLMTLCTLPLVVLGRLFINRFGGEIEY